MSNAKQIIEKYKEFIGNEVIDKFGGSYTNYQNYGDVWCQKMAYKPEIEEFIMARTKLFFRLLNVSDSCNLNMMYKVSLAMADHLSVYVIKKDPKLTLPVVKQNLVNELFVRSDIFINKFKKSYARSVDLSNKHYVEFNPGVVAIYKALQNQKQ